MRVKKFTEGMWKYEKGCDDTFPGQFFVVHDGTECDESVVCRTVYGEHDAHLIAAAPEMLESLENLQKQIQEVTDGTRPYTGFDTELIDAVIAKAYGE